MQQPFFAEQADIEEDAIERAQGTHRIRSVFQHVRGPDGVRRLEELRERPARDIVVQLLVVQAAAGQLFLAPALGLLEARAEMIHGVHRAWVVDVVGRDQRGVERAGARGAENLIGEAALIGFPRKDAIDPKILCADVRAEVFPSGMLWIFRRLCWNRR